jgi:hypothetical protein
MKITDCKIDRALQVNLYMMGIRDTKDLLKERNGGILHDIAKMNKDFNVALGDLCTAVSNEDIHKYKINGISIVNPTGYMFPLNLFKVIANEPYAKDSSGLIYPPFDCIFANTTENILNCISTLSKSKRDIIILRYMYMYPINYISYLTHLSEYRVNKLIKEVNHTVWEKMYYSYIMRFL